MRRNQRGAILLLSWMVVSGLTALTQVMLARSMTELMAANRFLAKQQAFQGAEGQLDDVLAALAKDPSSLLTGTCPPSVNPTRTSCTLEDVTQQLDPTATALQGTRQARIVVTGFMPNRTTPQAQATIEAIVEVDGAAIFQWPMFAEQVHFGVFGQNCVDGYDSTNGAYPYADCFSLHPRPILAKIRSNGKIYFDNSALSPYSQFWSDLMVGPSFTPASTGLQYAAGAESGVQLKGSLATAPAAIILPPVLAASGTPAGTPYLRGDCAVTDPSKVFDINANPPSMISVGANCKVTLQGNGSVLFDEITMGTQGTLQLEGNMLLTAGKLDPSTSMLRLATGSATIHVTDPVNQFVLTGDVDNATRVPKNLLFVLETTGQVHITSWLNAPRSIYGAIYAPNANYVWFHYRSSRCDWFGSVVTKNSILVNGNWQMH